MGEKPIPAPRLVQSRPMIHTFTLPRLGLVESGDGGSAASYTFDDSGLSNDPRLAYYLQDLTPAQLQNALDGKDPTQTLVQQLTTDITGSDLPCGTVESGDPFCNGGKPQGPKTPGLNLPNVPLTVWLIAGGTLAALILTRR